MEPYFFFTIIAAIIITFAWFRHNERMKLLEMGVPPKDWQANIRKRSTVPLFFGIFGVGIGAAILSSLPFGGVIERGMITGGLILLFGGASLVTYWYITGRINAGEKNDTTNTSA